MRLSESLRRNILRVGVGGIINKFKARERRDVLFFEDILANYIKECEDAGYEKEMEEIGRKWMNLVIANLFPSAIRKLPMPILSEMAKKIWANLGLIRDLHFKKENDRAVIETKDEWITRIIGKNSFAIGAFAGILNVFLGSKVRLIKSVQSRDRCRYVYRVEKTTWLPPESKKPAMRKTKEIAEERNFLLNDALRRKLFEIRPDNRLYFRRRSMVPVENTFQHLFSERKIMIKNVSNISYEYFAAAVDKSSAAESRLKLLKSILQITGWGSVKILVMLDGAISVEIMSPPRGLQVENDSWDFLSNVILGYVQLLDKKYEICAIKDAGDIVRMSFRRSEQHT